MDSILMFSMEHTTDTMLIYQTFSQNKILCTVCFCFFFSFSPETRFFNIPANETIEALAAFFFFVFFSYLVHLLHKLNKKK